MRKLKINSLSSAFRIINVLTKFAQIDFDPVVMFYSVFPGGVLLSELTLSWEFSSWAEEEEAAARRWPVWEPERISWGWAEGLRWSGPGFWAEAGCGAAWSDAVEVRCGRPAAAGGGGGDAGAGAGVGVGGADDADDAGGDQLDGYTVDAVVQNGRSPNEAPPHPSVAFAASVWPGGSK